MEFKLAVTIILLIAFAIFMFTTFIIIGTFLVSPIPQNFTNILISILILTQLFTCIIIMHLHDALTQKKR